MYKNRFTPKKLTMLGALIAVSILLSRVCVIYITSSIRIELGTIPIIFAGILFGPLCGLIVGALADIIGACFLSGLMYYPPLTVAPMLTGLMAGLLRSVYIKSPTFLKTFFCTMLTNTIAKILWTTYWLYKLYATPLEFLFATRVPLYCVIALIEAIIVYRLLRNKLFRNVIEKGDL